MKTLKGASREARFLFSLSELLQRHLAVPSLASLGFRFFSRVFRLLVCDHLLLFYTNKSGKESTNLVIVPSAQLSLPQCLKITKKVSFNFASEASYVYKVNENAKSGQIAAFTEHCCIH